MTINANKIYLFYSIVFYLLFNFIELECQENKNIDSLISKLKFSKSDTNKVNLLNQISESNLRNDPELSRKYSIDALNLSQDLRWEKGKANSLLRIGNSYYLVNNLENAYKFYKRALDIFEKNKILSGIGTAIGNIGLIYSSNGQNKKADSCYKAALKIGKQINDKKIIQRNYSNLGVLNSNLNILNVASDYYLKSIEILKEIHDENGLAITYSNIGNIYSRKESFDKAINYYLKALNLNLKNNNKIGLSYNYFNLAATYSTTKNYENSIYYHELNLKLQETLKDTSFIIDIKHNYADVQINLKKYSKALELLNEINDFIKLRNNKIEQFEYYTSIASLHIELLKSKIDTKNKNLKINKNDINLNKAKNYIKKAELLLDTNIVKSHNSDFYNIYSMVEYYSQNYEKSLICYQKYIELRDSINNKKNVNLIYEFENKLNLSEKNRELKFNQLKLANSKKNQLLTYFALGFVTILLITFVFLYNKITKLNKILEIKNNEVTEINIAKDKLFSIIAHDLINPISSFKNVTQVLTNDFENIPKEEQLEYLNLMKNSSQGVLEMLKNLLDWSRFQRGHIKLNIENIIIKNLVNQCISIFELTTKEKNINIINNIKNDLNANTDYNLFQTIFRNILSNAIKFSNDGGIIEVNTYENIEYNNKKYTEISIKDNGVGISKENLEILNKGKNHFSMFGTKNEKGTGLGLVLCKDYLKLLNGEMIIESELGLGTNIRILLPTNSNFN